MFANNKQLTHSFLQYLLSTCCVPGWILDIAVIKTDVDPLYYGGWDN